MSAGRQRRALLFALNLVSMAACAGSASVVQLGDGSTGPDRAEDPEIDATGFDGSESDAPDSDPPDSDGAGLPACEPIDSAAILHFLDDPLNKLVISSGCAPLGFSGLGRVRRIESGQYTGVLLIDIALDAPNVCELEVKPEVSILDSRTDLGLSVGAEVRVSLFGNDNPSAGSRQGAVVSLPDGAVLAAYYERNGEYLESFLQHLPMKVRFRPECKAEPARERGAICFESDIREQMVLPEERVLREYQAADVLVDGATFHVAFGQGRNFVGSTGRCSIAHFPPGRSFLFSLRRQP
jgi:hypothetical protein